MSVARRRSKIDPALHQPVSPGYRIVAAEQRGAKVKKKREIDPLHADTVRLIDRLALQGDGDTARWVSNGSSPALMTAASSPVTAGAEGAGMEKLDDLVARHLRNGCYSLTGLKPSSPASSIGGRSKANVAARMSPKSTSAPPNPTCA